MADVQHNALTGTDLHAPFNEGASAPGSPTSGMYWLNTTTMVLSRYNGTTWVEVSPTVAPLLPQSLPVYTAGNYVDPWVGGVVSGSISANIGVLNNQSIAVPIYLAKDCQIDAFAIPIATAASSGAVAKAALCLPDANGLPGEIIKVHNSVPLDVVGIGLGTFTPMNMARGFYWVAVIANAPFSTYTVTNPVSTPIPFSLTTGASKAVCQIPVNFVDQFQANWNQWGQTIGFGGNANRYAVRIA